MAYKQFKYVLKRTQNQLLTLELAEWFDLQCPLFYVKGF